MRRVDFSTVISIIIENCRENMHISKDRERAFTQTDLITGYSPNIMTAAMIKFLKVPQYHAG